MAARLTLILGALLLVQASQAANILCLFGSNMQSHLIVHMSVAKALADGGHHLTVATSMQPNMAPHENITLVLIPQSAESVQIFQDAIKEMSKKTVFPMWSMFQTMARSKAMVQSQYEFLVHPKLKAIYEAPDAKFDLLIVGFFINDYQMGVAAKLKVPVILNWVGIPFEAIDNLVGNINDPTYVPSLGVSNLRSMGQRMRNFLTYLSFKCIYYITRSHMNDFYDRAFVNYTDMPSYSEMRRSLSLLFTNIHSHSEGPVRPTVPQSIEIGGIQIKDQPDPLPSDIAEFLDNANDTGAILFSIGSHIRESYIPSHIMGVLFNVLSRLPQRVIWKCNDLDHLPGLSPNILYKKWLPQDDILAHPNLQLFITHAGKGSVAEAQFHGVPMLAIPIMGDQPNNAAIMAEAGFGLNLELHYLTEQSLTAGISEVLANPLYRSKVRQFSTLYRDRPLTARQSVVYWTEYVLRHKGAHHLQSPSVQMGFVARHNLDIYAILLLLLGVFLLLMRCAVRFAWRRLFSKSNKKSPHATGKSKTN